MAQPVSPAGVAQQVEGAARDLAPWIERFARIGYVAKSAVYIIVGVLAARAAFGAGGRTTGSEGALATILAQPYGKVLLVLMAVGLFGYAAWRAVVALLDPELKGSDAKGMARRTGDAAKAVLHAAFAVEALRLVAGSTAAGDGTQDWTRRLLSMPFGRWLVGIAGAVVIGYGLYQLYRAYAAKLTKWLDLSSLSANASRWAIRFGRFGLAARGVVFGLIGIFLIRAATRYDASEARGLGGALQAIQQQDRGAWLLGIVALGLTAYGLYELVEARYRRIRAV